MNKKRRLRSEIIGERIFNKVEECRIVYDSPKISRHIKKTYSYTLADRTKTALTALSNKMVNYLSHNLEACSDHARTTYELFIVRL